MLCDAMRKKADCAGTLFVLALCIDFPDFFLFRYSPHADTSFQRSALGSPLLKD